MAEHKGFFMIMLAALLTLQGAAGAFAASFDHQGQITGWLTANFEGDIGSQAGLRYIPEITFEHAYSNGWSLDAEASVNAFGVLQGTEFDDLESDGDVDPYRAWLRLSSSRFEARLGLQKINFGSAALFRPLMWFDSLDPRDPLQLTDGVYGLLMRYYFLNNANVWVWGLYGNDEVKGWELIPSDERRPEFGGRIQAPLLGGEMGFAAHHRTIDLGAVIPGLGEGFHQTAPENRIGLDGRWDWVIGFWFEGALARQESDLIQLDHTRSATVGMDYTFGLGNGLHLLGEHFLLERADTAFVTGEGVSFTALSTSYPFGIMDNMSAIFYYDWENEDLYSFVNWQRTYDFVSLHLIGFWNPDRVRLYQTEVSHDFYAGKGIQFMTVFNY